MRVKELTPREHAAFWLGSRWVCVTEIEALLAAGREYVRIGEQRCNGDSEKLQAAHKRALDAARVALSGYMLDVEDAGDGLYLAVLSGNARLVLPR